jgi:hypothetical protein
LPDVQVGTGLSLDTLLYPQWEKVVYGLQPDQLWTISRDRVSAVLDEQASAPILLTGSRIFDLSPSGRYLLVTTPVERVPQAWEFYESASTRLSDKILADAPNKKGAVTWARPQQYAIIDLQRRTMVALIAAWSHDEREVALSNTFVPLNAATSTGHARLTRPCVVVVQLATHRVECVRSSQIDSRAIETGSNNYLSHLEWSFGDQQIIL